jgi:hypothetical protein
MSLLSFNLPILSGAGPGTAVLVSTINTLRTLIIDGAFGGKIAIEGSDDGVHFDSIVGSGLYETPGIYLVTGAARTVRATRSGNVSGSPTVTLVGESVPDASATAAVSSVAAATLTTTLLPANTTRRMAVFFNDSNVTLYLKYGTGAATNSYTVKILSQGYFEMPVPVPTGIITGIWDAGPTGVVLITEQS